MIDVHIVHHGEDHIIPRMARWLADELGWSIGLRPRANAQLNYYMPYTAYNPLLAGRTKSAAWFTHHEAANRGKARQWREAANAVDLRVSTSQLYLGDLSQKGATAKITPGIDVDLFRIADRDEEISFLGFSGLGSDRKGTQLARRLVDGGWKAIAAGKSWDGIPTRWFEYEQMPQFYSGIDIFVCTSTIEGIPAPPLEALACGTRVIIPRGVGIMDELPERPGVRHYDSGDLDSLRVAIRRCVYEKQQADPQELREIILNNYTIEHWAASHARAFEEALE